MNKDSTDQQYQTRSGQVQAGEQYQTRTGQVQTGDQYQTRTGQVQTGDQYYATPQSFQSAPSDQFSRDSSSPMGYQSQNVDRSMDQTFKSSQSFSVASSPQGQNTSFSVANSPQGQNTSVSLGFNPSPSSILQAASVSPQYSQMSHTTQFSQGAQSPFPGQGSLLQPPPPPSNQYFRQGPGTVQ